MIDHLDNDGSGILKVMVSAATGAAEPLTAFWAAKAARMSKYRIGIAVCLALVATPAAAVTISDPVGDFLPSFAGTTSPDLDVTNFSVVFDGTNFLLGATLAGDIVPSNNALYVIGINTGTGINHPFANIGEPNVAFNQVILLNGATGIATLGSTTLESSITGNAFSILLPGNLPISTGNSPAQYSFALWPRVGLGNNNQISDFAPQNAMLTAGAVPEPASWAMMLVGFAGVGAALRRSRRRPLAQLA
jgi:hypothetical protein